jgi:hypothetical protein
MYCKCTAILAVNLIASQLAKKAQTKAFGQSDCHHTGRQAPDPQATGPLAHKDFPTLLVVAESHSTPEKIGCSK